MKKSICSAKLSLILLSILLTLACSGGGGGGGDSPVPTPTAHMPSISNLLHSPQTAVEDSGDIQVTATIDFVDSGADAASFTLKVYDSQSRLLSTQTNQLSNASGVTSGNITIIGIVSTADLGNYTFSISIADSAGNSSNALTGTFQIVVAPAFYAQTLLLRGNWHFVYTIIDVFTNDYSLTTMSMETNSQGGYYIWGTGEYGDDVLATYWPVDSIWSLNDEGTIIDRYYEFYTDGVNVLPSSCYYQIEVSTGNWSDCFPLSGSKTDLPAGLVITKKAISVKKQKEEQISENVIFAPPIDDKLVERYLDHKNITSLK